MIHQAKRFSILFVICILLYLLTEAQTESRTSGFTHADSLRGSLNAERRYDVLKYDISITPDFETRSISGNNKITYIDSGLKFMQVDLQFPLVIDSIVQDNERLHFIREGNVFHVQEPDFSNTSKTGIYREKQLTVYYHGNPHIAANPPWDNGFIFTKDKLGRPWMTVTCEGDGASLWFPCKDYLGDKPDRGASLSVTIPDSLTAVANGRLLNKKKEGNGKSTWVWAVSNPINSYNIIPYIGKYVSWRTNFMGQKGNLECNFWVLDYNLTKARKHFTVVDSTLTSFEYWYGPYPFYEDGYKLVEAPYPGMEHQSAIAYGNKFMQGYLGKDLSETGWGLKWDYMIVHESSHEWFGNNITDKDIADQWIHESFANYSEVLYTGFYFGKAAGDQYCIGLRKKIENITPIIGYYGVNKSPDGTDEYFKGSNMIHIIRQIIHNEEIFRRILRGLNQEFYHGTVTGKNIEEYINKTSGIDFTPVFDQYLRTTQIPVFEYKLEGSYLMYRWTNCISGFNMPIRVDCNGVHWLKASAEWKKEHVSKQQNPMLIIDENFYVGAKDSSQNR
jgi:aminopeptidase N